MGHWGGAGPLGGLVGQLDWAGMTATAATGIGDDMAAGVVIGRGEGGAAH